MVAPAAGAVVLVRFQFSPQSPVKLRPALVLEEVGKDHYVLCQITSKAYDDGTAVHIEQTAFASGSLGAGGYARPGRLFTVSRNFIDRESGVLRPATLKRVVEAVVTLLRGTASVTS